MSMSSRYGPDGLRMEDPASSSMTERDPFLSRGAHLRSGRYDGQQQATYMSTSGYGPDGLKLEDPDSAGAAPPDPEMARAAQKAARRGHAQSIAVKVVVPWFMFIVVSVTIALMPPTLFFRILAYLIAGLFLGLGSLLLHLHVTKPEQSTFYYHVGCLSIMAVLLGVLVGLQVYDHDMSQYWMYSSGPEYTNINATQPAASFPDAGSIVFSDSARVDLRRPFGMRPQHASETYCVAPILDETELSKVNFWAVGRDCCEPSWGFRCDASRNPQAHAGAVLTPGSSAFAGELYERYRMAAQQAAATYNLYTPDRPVFVRWLSDTAEVRGAIFRHSLVWLGISSLLYLMVCLLVAFWLHLAQGRAKPGRLTAWSAFDRPR